MKEEAKPFIEHLETAFIKIAYDLVVSKRLNLKNWIHSISEFDD
jgi:hypothetical protein